jgi:hypothetical protein
VRLRLRQRVARWALGPTYDLVLKLHEGHGIGRDCEVVIAAGKVWVNLDGKCAYRVVADNIDVVQR